MARGHTTVNKTTMNIAGSDTIMGQRPFCVRDQRDPAELTIKQTRMRKDRLHAKVNDILLYQSLCQQNGRMQVPLPRHHRNKYKKAIFSP